MICCLQSIVNVEEKAQLIDTLQRLVTGVIDEIEKKMSDYLIGNLSIVFHHQEQSKHAQPQSTICMQSKHLGLQIITSERHITLIKVGFIDGKVKCKKNNTLLWLSGNSQNEMNDLITFTAKKMLIK